MSHPVDGKLTMTEALNSLNGVEYSNANVLSKGRLLKLIEIDAIDAMYVLITVLKQRDNKQTTLADVRRDLCIGDVNKYFASEPETDDEDSELGND